MTKMARWKRDPLEIEIEAALGPGRFVSDDTCFAFASDIEQVESDVANLVRSAPARAVTLYEAFLAGCYEKAEEVDDSSGSLGMFVAKLFCGWIRARQAAGSDPAETTARLIAWIEDDVYGFYSHIEKDMAAALDRAGRVDFAKQIRSRLHAQTESAEDSSGPSAHYSRRPWGEVLRALYVVQKDVAAYVGLAEQTGLTAQDCRAIATMLVARRQPEEALSWVERGLGAERQAPYPSPAGHDLAHLQRELLSKLGRGDDALVGAWAEYRDHPSKYSYAELMNFVPEAERPAWHERAIAAAAGADPESLIELLLQTKEIERLAEFVGHSSDDTLRTVSHSALEPAARKIEKSHAGKAARVWRAMAMRVVDAKKSQYYGAALVNLKRAKRCYEKAGLAADWNRVVDEVRAEHSRKTGFMPGFEEIVSRSRRVEDRSFLEQAKARWARSR